MDLLLLALLIQHTALPDRVDPARAPRLSYTLAAGERRAPEPRRVPRARIDWGALDQSLAPGARRERGRRDAPARETLWNGVPVRIIDGQVHGIW